MTKPKVVKEKVEVAPKAKAKRLDYLKRMSSTHRILDVHSDSTEFDAAIGDTTLLSCWVFGDNYKKSIEDFRKDIATLQKVLDEASAWADSVS
jgi:hypothetical protein